MELRLRAPFKWLVPAIVSGPVLPSASVFASSAKKAAKVSFSRRLAQYPWRVFLRFLGGGEALYRVGPSPELLAWVQEFRPEVLYGHCSDLNSIRFLCLMRQALDIPLVLHVMDDFPEAHYCKGMAAKFLRRRYLNEFAELVRSADITIAICQEMAEEYKERYQREIIWLPMPVEMDAYQDTARTRWTAGEPFLLRYGGRVGWAIQESLADVARAVHAARQAGANLAFDLVTFQMEQVPDACFAASGVSVQRPGSLADLPRMQAEADVLVICYDFDQESFRRARYSMPSKLADCMASGTPILVYGPAGLPVVEYARREGWGMVVDRRDPVALGLAVRELMDSTVLREKLGTTAQRLAAERHDATAVSREMQGIFGRLKQVGKQQHAR